MESYFSELDQTCRTALLKGHAETEPELFRVLPALQSTLPARTREFHCQTQVLKSQILSAKIYLLISWAIIALNQQLCSGSSVLTVFEYLLLTQS